MKKMMKLLKKRLEYLQLNEQLEARIKKKKSLIKAIVRMKKNNNLKNHKPKNQSLTTIRL